MSGLPLEKEVGFGLDVILGTTPILKAPYRVVSNELKELKMQIQELFGKGFICLSISP